MTLQTLPRKGALFSPCRTYRYLLWRTWDPSKPPAMFLGLNPSTATEEIDDPTVRRCIQYAFMWGYGSLWMANIFSFRATDPKEMKAASEPIGQDNDRKLKCAANWAGVIVAAWGNHGEHLNRAEQVEQMLAGRLSCLTVTGGGHPGHPLYLKKDLKPVEYHPVMTAVMK